MDTYRLKYFCTIAETGSLTKAADVLGISHSGLSKAISALEDETKLKLFLPQGRGLQITDAGKWFYQKAQDILKIENEISHGMQSKPSKIRVGLAEALAITCAGHIVREMARPLSIIETDIGELEAKILGGDLDFGFVFSPAFKPELEYLKIGDVRFNSFARADFLQTHDPEQYVFTVPTTHLPFNPLGYKIRDGWPQEIPRIAPFSVSSFAIALDLLRLGESIVYMPNFVAHLENERNPSGAIVKVPSHRTAESKRQLFLVKAKSADESKEMKKITKVLRRICCSSNI